MQQTTIKKFAAVGVLLAMILVSFTPSIASASGTVWTNTAAVGGNGESWFSVVWSPQLSLFVAIENSVTSTTAVMTSPDGVTWTLRTTPSVALNCVTWSPQLGLFVAVGNPAVITSPDGITWTSRTASDSISWRSVTWSPQLGIFVAVSVTNGSTNRVMTSPDGITWTSHASAATDVQYNGVTWAATAPNGSGGQGLFVAVGRNGVGDDVMTSPDGITWTSRTPALDWKWQSVAWSPELGIFAAVGYNGATFVMTSPDGITWTAETGVANKNWTTIAWSPELHLFVAVGTDTGGGGSTGGVMSSPNGITWTDNSPASATTYGKWQGVAWSPELGIFSVVMAQVDGTEISDITAPTQSAISATPTSTSATITWTTDMESSSQVNYGTTTGYGTSSTLDPTLVLGHSVTLSGLTCATPYDYQVSSTYIENTLSGNNTFTTTACPVAAAAPVSHGAGAVIPVVPVAVANQPLDFTVASQSGTQATLYLNADPNTVKGYAIGLTPDLSDATGILPYARQVTYTLPDADVHTIYLKYYSTTGNWSPVISQSTAGTMETTAVAISSPTLFTRTLKLGSTGSDVTTLQQFLNSHGFLTMPPSVSYGYYGALTKNAMMKFQDANASTILTPLELSAGTGIFGSATMQFVNAVLLKVK